MKNMNGHGAHAAACKACVEKCQQGIDTLQKLVDLCSISITPECAAQCGKSVKVCNEIIETCTKCIDECQKHMVACEHAACRKHCKDSIDACKACIEICKKSIQDCRAERGECLQDSILAVKKFAACARACQACADFKH